ncbi:MAG: bifunctional (p)ppGpp synthetase/guanosine-3',5'-bis(diphosphate) 3'-pyrophosphohydrolase [Bacteroidetes bacterium]|nr:bifunctional (p)ppGpp synthetase/guanosine-3',5'-bis(diphosphate) 3'-pyrophosphohydrolase [Bacteroidota bacterium]
MDLQETQSGYSFEFLRSSLLPHYQPQELALLDKAYEQALDAYKGRKLTSGEDFIRHNIEVACIAVNELGLRLPTAISALLHSLKFEDDEDFRRVETTYGKEVSVILRGFVRISQLPTERLSYQSEQYRKLFLSLIDDIRVIILKIAHRVYDLRNLPNHNADKLEKYILEVKHLYVPITHRLGLYKIKSEFEESVMRYEHADVYASIEQMINATRDRQEAFMQSFIRPIEEQLRQHQLDCTIKWRTKSIPSIWAKMKSQQVSFEQVYDLFAIRIIANSPPKREKEDCWRIYSIVTDLYPPNPKRLRDWITTPKASGYESLHTTVKGPEDKWVEVQIRTERMDQNAEKGQAAHWLYKEKSGKFDMEDWLNQVRDVLENPDQLQFDAYKRSDSIGRDKIFVFTPNGDLKQLPGGATVLDFAYEVHTQVGSTCNGARVNNKVVPIRHVLQNGDKVEIITSKKQSPRADWLNFVVTERAKSKIRKYLKDVELREAEIGKEMLLRKLKNWKIVSSEDIINNLVRHYKTNTAMQLYHQIATEKIDLIELKKYLTSQMEEGRTGSQRPMETDPKIFQEKLGGKDDYLVIDENISNVNFKLARCCNPIPGDDVTGFVTINTGITIHRKGCANAARMYERYPYRFLKVRWKQQADQPHFIANIRVSGKDTLGLVNEITRLISSDLKVNMRAISFNTRDGAFEGRISLQIRDTDHLEQLMHKLGKVNGVEKVSRAD